MPFQFYLTADPAPFEPASWLGDWNATTDAVTRRLDSTKTTADPTMYTIQSVTSSESSADILYKKALVRYVSGPLIAQRISGTMQLMVGVKASSESAEMYFAIHAWVTSGDTSVPRGTLIDNFSELQSSFNAWPTDEKGRNLVASAAMSALNVQNGDRLVIEAGYIARNALSTTFSGSMYYGTDYYSNGSPDMVRDP